MGKHSRHYTDLNPLEGGGSGAGMGRYKSSPKKSYDPDAEAEKIIGLGFGAPLAAAGTMAAIGSADRTATKAGDEKRAQDRREAKSEMKRESRGKEDSMTAGQKQSMQEAKDEESYQKRKTAPTTKTEMGEAFAKGGMTASSRADGCAQRGKTRGTVI
tara:strand:+ start:115 stop:588 length:474 start_codon:yes stop_codon:yes gene_type:complete